MTDEVLFERAELLLKQGRLDDAEKVLGELLRLQPDNAYIYYQLSEINLGKNNPDRAEELIDNAIGLNPEIAAFYYTKSRIYLFREKTKTAEEYILQAIEMQPQEAAFFGLLAHIKLVLKEFEGALQAANEALALDPSNLFALNVRSTALLKLGRKEESFDAISEALHEQPNDSYTHSNYGWGLLERGDAKGALNHFGEALKNDPNSKHAQAGMVEALKARFAVYRWFLKYNFWMANLTSKYQWFVILGFYFGTKFLSKAAAANETLGMFLYPIVFLLFFAAFFTWIANPIGNLFLLLNPYGKYLLDKDEKAGAVGTGICLLASLVGITGYIISPSLGFLALAGVGFTLMIPVSSFNRKPKAVFGLYSLVMVIIGMVIIAGAFATGTFINNLETVYLVGLLAFQFLANYFVIRTS